MVQWFAGQIRLEKFLRDAHSSQRRCRPGLIPKNLLRGSAVRLLPVRRYRPLDLAGGDALSMRNLFAVSWLTAGRRTLLSIAAALVVVLGIFALLKIGSGGKQVPAPELITGSIQRSPVAAKRPANDPMAAFLAPAEPQLAPRPMQSTAMDRGAVPLPRPRPNRL
jgi:hypothetical protein